MGIKIDHEKCCFKKSACEQCEGDIACAHCVEVCPVGAIEKDDVIKINEEQCILCGACVATCKQEALSFE